MDYRVIGVVVPESTIISVPPGVIPLSVVYPPGTDRLTFVCLVPVESASRLSDAKLEEPGEKKESREADDLAGNIRKDTSSFAGVIDGKLPISS